MTGLVEGLGQDLVAMCVNDVLCHGGEPLFFLDYFATSSLRNSSAITIISSIAQACTDSNCTLIGTTLFYSY
jgi:phosphoribosylformylglycinamidine cyclo-ligase